ncbi:hypothetical protein M885DRAFT_579326 [Pelagophyceae sp. CCMP2097]|nr:hypothetical protein M885DRAFT_579326 [Pelagophyceae sp. CCMP2097]
MGRAAHHQWLCDMLAHGPTSCDARRRWAKRALSGDAVFGVRRESVEAVWLLELAVARGVAPAHALFNASHQKDLGVEAPDLDRALHLYKTTASAAAPSRGPKTAQRTACG